MPTQAEVRQKAKQRVRRMRHVLKQVDTRLELMDRRLVSLLDVDRLITVRSFDSYLKNMDGFFVRIRALETNTIHAMTTFLID